MLGKLTFHLFPYLKMRMMVMYSECLCGAVRAEPGTEYTDSVGSLLPVAITVLINTTTVITSSLANSRLLHRVLEKMSQGGRFWTWLCNLSAWSLGGVIFFSLSSWGLDHILSS